MTEADADEDLRYIVTVPRGTRDVTIVPRPGVTITELRFIGDGGARYSGTAESPSGVIAWGLSSSAGTIFLTMDIQMYGTAEMALAIVLA